MYLDAVVVGAGFSGLCTLWRLRNLGLSVKVLERADDIGGTWYYNQYPGARCDTPSLEYQFLTPGPDLVKGWTWSERYPSQPEILRYINYVADTLDLRKDIILKANVKRAEWDQKSEKWFLTTEDGVKIQAKYFIIATGVLSEPIRPVFHGLEHFKKEIYYSNAWPKDTKINLKGKKVAVVGTGSSGTQVVHKIASEVSHLYVFQRTPHFSTPAQNRYLKQEEIDKWKRESKEIYEDSLKMSGFLLSDPPTQGAMEVSEEERKKRLQSKWEEGGFNFLFAFHDFWINQATNDFYSDFIRAKIRGIVKDPKVADLLCPQGYAYATKRPVIDHGYFEVFNQSNVELVDISKDEVRFGPEGAIVKDRKYDVDVVIFATGFDAWTGPIFGIETRGIKQTIKEAWSERPKAYLATVISGFPNLFMVVNGPQHPFAFTNTIRTIEWHANWIVDMIKYMETHKIKSFDAEEKAQEAWTQHCTDLANQNLLAKAKSWYVGSNVPGKPRVVYPYTGSLTDYIDKCMAVEKAGYDGFKFSLESRL